VANANKLNSTVYFFFGVFLGLTALVFFGDLVAFFAGLAAGFLSLLQN
jgi:VIT1/CCC1 family predicted Fe2+/Mn2+ transporter